MVRNLTQVPNCEYRRLKGVAQAVIKNAARHHFMDFCSTLGRLSSSSKPIKNAPKCIILNIEFQNFLGGDTPEPPLREGTLTPGHPLWQFLATPLPITVAASVRENVFYVFSNSKKRDFLLFLTGFQKNVKKTLTRFDLLKLS